MLAAGVAAIVVPVLRDVEAPVVVGIGGVAVLVGTIVAGPALARIAVFVLGAPLRVLRGITGNLARQNAMRSPRRTSRTAAALTVGVGVVTVFTVIGSSLVASIDETVAGSMRSDLVVQSEGFTGVGIDPTLAPKIAKLPEVARRRSSSARSRSAATRTTSSQRSPRTWPRSSIPMCPQGRWPGFGRTRSRRAVAWRRSRVGRWASGSP